MVYADFRRIVTIFVSLFTFTNAIAITPKMHIETKVFGTTSNDEDVIRYTLFNSKGHSVSLMNFGASLLEVMVPDRLGQLDNVNLCFEEFKPYEKGHPYFGSSVGRFCNRIGEGKFQIDGVDYQVTLNSGKHHLHGGKNNFSYRLWEAELLEGSDFVGVQFSLVSADGEEGYPGTLKAQAVYQWNEADELTIKYLAETDAPTHVNLTNHSYWNLAGAGSGTALQHIATIEADQWLDVDADLIPSGKYNEVAETPLDFRVPSTLGARLAELEDTKGYDHCYVIRGETGVLRQAAKIIDPKTGRTLEIETTQPGMQLYTANHLPGNQRSNGYQSHHAFCLETQHYPNSPNIVHFPSTLLRPGQMLSEITVHRFGVND